MDTPKKRELHKLYVNDPLLFVQHVFNAEPTKQQRKVLEALRDGKRHIAVRSGHGVGKTCLEAWIIIWFICVKPHCRIPCTAPTQTQLYDVLWAEIGKWLNKIHPDFKWYKDRLEWTSTHLTNKDYPEDWFAVAKSSNKPENMAGFHCTHLLFIIDEASGVDHKMMEVIQGTLTEEDAYCLMFGNPTQTVGMFFDAFHRERDYWATFHFSCIDSERVTDEYVQRFKNKYGEDSNAYRVRVLGEFPLEGDDAIIPLSWAEQAANNEVDIDEKFPVFIGADIARFGDDKTVIIIRRGNRVLDMKIHSKKSTMETSGIIYLQAKKYAKENKVTINIDDSGVGGGVTDRLKEMTDTDKMILVQGINNGSSATQFSEDGMGFNNLGCQLWYYMRENIRDWDIPNDDELISQLSTRTFTITSNGIVKIERKDEMKKRGLQSPDKADALALAFYDEVDTGAFVLF